MLEFAEPSVSSSTVDSDVFHKIEEGWRLTIDKPTETITVTIDSPDQVALSEVWLTACFSYEKLVKGSFMRENWSIWFDYDFNEFQTWTKANIPGLPSDIIGTAHKMLQRNRKRKSESRLTVKQVESKKKKQVYVLTKKQLETTKKKAAQKQSDLITQRFMELGVLMEQVLFRNSTAYDIFRFAFMFYERPEGEQWVGNLIKRKGYYGALFPQIPSHRSLIKARLQNSKEWEKAEDIYVINNEWLLESEVKEEMIEEVKQQQKSIFIGKYFHFRKVFISMGFQHEGLYNSEQDEDVLQAGIGTWGDGARIEWPLEMGRVRIFDFSGQIYSREEPCSKLEHHFTFIGNDGDLDKLSRIRNEDMAWVQKQLWKIKTITGTEVLVRLKLKFIGGDNKYLFSEMGLRDIYKEFRCSNCFARVGESGWKYVDNPEAKRTLEAHRSLVLDPSTKGTKGCIAVPLYARNAEIDISDVTVLVASMHNTGTLIEVVFKLLRECVLRRTPEGREESRSKTEAQAQLANHVKKILGPSKTEPTNKANYRTVFMEYKAIFAGILADRLLLLASFAELYTLLMYSKKVEKDIELNAFRLAIYGWLLVRIMEGVAYSIPKATKIVKWIRRKLNSLYMHQVLFHHWEQLLHTKSPFDWLNEEKMEGSIKIRKIFSACSNHRAKESIERAISKDLMWDIAKSFLPPSRRNPKDTHVLDSSWKEDAFRNIGLKECVLQQIPHARRELENLARATSKQDRVQVTGDDIILRLHETKLDDIEWICFCSKCEVIGSTVHKFKYTAPTEEQDPKDEEDEEEQHEAQQLPCEETPVSFDEFFNHEEDQIEIQRAMLVPVDHTREQRAMLGHTGETPLLPCANLIHSSTTNDLTFLDEMEDQYSTFISNQTTVRSPYTCSKCGQPKKGHNCTSFN